LAGFCHYENTITIFQSNKVKGMSMKKETTTTSRRTGGSKSRNTSTKTGKNTGRKSTKQAQSGNNGQQEENEQQQQGSSLLEKMFVTLLQDMYSGEKQLVEALTKMQQQATTEELQDAFEDHKYITQKHASRLEKIFGQLGITPGEKPCVGIEGLVNEAETVIEETEEGTMTRDAALIIAAQKVEHYEIAAYGSLVQLALTLGHTDIAMTLEKTLLEEEHTDLLLTDIAECEVNPLADEEPVEMMAELEETV
jgi:ferritin-like metal-binding protein YciE